ncbi:MAG: cytochrome c [Sphingomonas sp.]|nr:cytochrome c [Sphingomonas sp.]
MRKILFALAALGLLSAAATPKLSGAKAKAVMHERRDGMEKVGKTMKSLARQIKSGAPDMADVQNHAAVMNGLAQKAATWFPAGTGPNVRKTGAKAEIWQKPEDFAAKMKAFQIAAGTLNRAAQTGNAASAAAAFSDLGKSCKACHDSYRTEHH